MSGGFNNPIIGGGGALVYPAIHSPNFMTGVSGWTIRKDGSAEFSNLVIRGTFFGLDFEINNNGLFFYTGPPANGNLAISIARVSGTDSHGNNYNAGVWTYVGAQLAGLANAVLELGASTDAILASVQAQAGINHITSGAASGPNLMAQLSLLDSVASGTGLPAALLNCALSMTAAAPGGQILVVQDTAGAPTNSILEIIAQAAADNALGIMVTGDAFNRWKLTTEALLAGPGNAAQDTRLYRSAAGVFAVDTLVANNGGTAEVYQSLGLPGITGWTSDRGRFRFAPDGEVEFDIVLHSNAVAHASSIITYPNTLPAAYRPAFNRAYPLGIDTTITAGDPYPRLFIGTTGTVKIAIPSVAAVTTEISGNIRMPLN